MAQTPREVGTLIAVILKARNLPNKRHIGKQTPYCTVVFNGEKRRTKSIHRGGQHPEWDEEIRFTLFEDDEGDIPQIEGLDAPPPPPKKDSKTGKRKIKGGNHLTVSVYADDPREPDLIGETKIDLTEVLTKGETDEWFTLNHKDRYSGEIYFELTFYSNEPEPMKKQKPKETKPKNYGGAGSFTPAGSSSSLSTPPEGRSPARTPSNDRSNNLPSSLIPPSLRSSSTSSSVGLYVAPYETGGASRTPSYSSSIPSVDSLTSDFGEMGIGHPHRRRESFPPTHQAHTPRQSSYSYAPSSQGYQDGSYGASGSSYDYDQPVTPTGPSHYDPRPYPPYGDESQPSNFSNRPRARTSLPAPSGFVPINNTGPSGFVPMPSHTPEPSAYASQMYTVYDQPTGYQQPMHEQVTGYPPPMPSHTPAPMDYPPMGMQPTGPPSGPSSFYPPVSSFHYSQYPPAPPASAPPQPYIPSHTPAGVPPPSHSAPPQPFHVYGNGGSAPHGDYSSVPPPPPLANNSSPATPTSSRPLPQPSGPHRQGSLPLPPSSGFVPISSPSGLNLPPPPPLQQGMTSGPLALPPPPPLPSQHSPHGMPLNVATVENGLPIPPTQPQSAHSPTRPALPKPPAVSYPVQQSAFEALPYIPPPPGAQPAYPGLPPPSHANSLPAPPNHHPFPGPPPRPPSSIAYGLPHPPVHSQSM